MRVGGRDKGGRKGGSERKSAREMGGCARERQNHAHTQRRMKRETHMHTKRALLILPRTDSSGHAISTLNIFEIEIEIEIEIERERERASERQRESERERARVRERDRERMRERERG